MNRKHLGDSYDIVKRLWRDLLDDWAPLYAEPRFVLEELRCDFRTLTHICCLPGELPDAYSILNDPDTGIRLPGNFNQSESRRHISIARIAAQTRRPGVHCVVTFDQSHYRSIALRRRSQQRHAKLQALRKHGVPAFYYASHAPFLFAFAKPAYLAEVRRRPTRAGLPSTLIERIDD